LDVIIKNAKLINIFENTLSVTTSISFWLFVAALPPFRIGIWVDSECVLVAAHMIFAIIGLCLSILWSAKRNLFCSKHTLIFAGFAIFSLVGTLWAKNPILHHLGVPLLGEGTILFFGLYLLSFGLDNIFKKDLIHWSAIFAGIAAGLLVFLHHPKYGSNINPDWLPYVFGAFLAPIALGVYIISTLTTNKLKYGMLLFLSGFLLFLSHNKTAWVAVFAVICFSMIARKTKPGYCLQKYLSASIPLASVIAIYSLGKLPQFSTLESRKLAIQSYVLTWKDEPFSLLFGNGWGYYFENLQKTITALPVVFFNDHSWKPSWDGIDRLDFHCMHLGVESLFSTGLIGLVFYIMLILTPFDGQNSKKVPFNVLIFTVLFGSLTSTWFTLVCVWPFFILGFSTLNKHTLIINRAPLTILWLGISTVFCAHGAFTYWQTAVLYPANPNSLFFRFTNSKKLPSEAAIKKTYNYQGFHLGHFTLNTLKKINRTPSRAITAELNLVFKVYDPKTSPLVLDVAMLHGMQYFQGPDSKKQNMWENVARAVLQKAPKRSDLLISYIKELIENHQLDKAKSFIDIMLVKNVNNPCALWLQGIYHIHERDVEHGKNLMIQALDQGIEKWVYIPKSLKNKLKGKPLL
jgi:hypothetical protein